MLEMLASNHHPEPNNNYIHIYIYIGSSYTWRNSGKVTHFLHRKFIRDLTVKKKNPFNQAMFIIFLFIINKKINKKV